MFITTFYYCTRGKRGGLKVMIEIIRSENVDNNIMKACYYMNTDVPVYT